MSLSDYIAVMRMGRVEQYGTPEDVYSRPANKYVARFIGSPQLDIFSGQFKRENGRIFYQIGQGSIQVQQDFEPPGGDIDLGVRPEYVMLGERGFPATVRLVQPVGPFTYVTVTWDGGSATARISGISSLRPKDPIRVDFDPSGLLFFDRKTEKLHNISLERLKNQ